MNTNFKQETHDISVRDGSDPSALPIMEVRRNPHTKLYAVFFRINNKEPWKELAKDHPIYGFDRGSLRTKFKFIAHWRMRNQLVDFYKRQLDYHTRNKFY